MITSINEFKKYLNSTENTNENTSVTSFDEYSGESNLTLDKKIHDKLEDDSDETSKALLAEFRQEGTDTDRYHELYAKFVDEIIALSHDFNRDEAETILGHALDSLD